MAYTTEMNVNGVLTNVTHFDHSAQEIDDAVNAAHAGLVHSKYVFSSSNGSDEAIDDVLATEYNSMADKTSRLIVIENNKAGLTLPRSTFFVRIDRTDAGYGALTAIGYHTGVTNTLTRSIYGRTWYPWSWENPPMQLGVEYRTTERWNGKAVYAKCVDFGTLPNTEEKRVNHGISGVDKIIYASATAWVGNEVMIINSNTYYITDFRAGQNVVAIRTNADMTSWTNCVFTLKYTKN